jgi:2',3'-cyclic-nucleotide 2'-phosphodiesterase (5'-nucleotidase family)
MHAASLPRRQSRQEASVRTLLALVLVVLPAFAAFAAAEVRSAVVVYSGNLDGELEPCGCSADGDLGGLKRQASTLERLRAARPDLFVVSSGGLLSSYHAHERITGDFILKGVQALHYDAMGVQWTDLAYGVGFVDRPDLPWVVSNWQGHEFQVARRIERGNVALAVFAWLDPTGSPQADMRAGGNPAGDDNAALRKALRTAKERGDVTVLTTTMPRDAVTAQFPLQDVDIVLLKSAYEQFGEPLLVDGTLFLEPGSRGMRLGRAEIDIDANGDIKTYRHEVIAMPASVPDAPGMQAWYDDYNAAVKDAYLRSVAVRKSMESGERRYVGAQVCKQCHGAAFDIWSKARHARAFDALERVGKAFDPDCIVCHTVGFNQDGGYIDNEVTGHLANVQCENCHGFGRDHATSGGQKPLGNKGWDKAKICGQCHVASHSPRFSLDAYWPRIAH